MKTIGESGLRREAEHFVELLKNEESNTAANVSANRTREIQEQTIETLADTARHLLIMYLAENHNVFYLYHWSRDCDCVESSCVSKHSAADRNEGEVVDDYIERLILEDAYEAEGPSTCHLISASVYERLLKNPEPIRDRIAEARDNGNPSPFSV